MSLTLIRTKADFRSTLSAKTSAFTFNVPAGYFIKFIIIENDTANAITGGLKFGTTLGGTEVISALAVGSSALVHATDSALTKRIFSKTAATTIYVDAVTAWNSASIDAHIILGRI